MSIAAMLIAPWCLAGLATGLLGRLERVFAPGWLLRLLAVTALLFAAATAVSAVAALSIVAADPAPAGVLLAAGPAVFLATCCGRAARHCLRVVAGLRGGRVFRRSHARRGDLLIVDDETPDAFAVPGRGAVVVVTAGLRAVLRRDEFAALVRHERAHLQARHYLFVQAAELAACLNPMLVRWPRLVRFAAERDADERAAGTERDVLARALARAALICAHRRPPAAAAALDIAAGDVVRRVTALQRPRPAAPSRWPVVAGIAVLSVTLANMAVTTDVAQDRIAAESGEASAVVVG